ncbi:hypothetical protein F0562_021736 [Nyssa sinensis]|uniref:Uncharacterized protein n=1 Tax=Nyssa sinensis TaxID=561372 RepID=A0A5J5BQM9_9ASTE|nr:hypothetical protein F0562_021736 [Nyssa sinensis]
MPVEMKTEGVEEDRLQLLQDVRLKLFQEAQFPWFRLYATSVVPIGAMFAMTLWLGNTAYFYISVAFAQMLIAITIAGVAAYNNLKLKKEASRGPSNESQPAESIPLVPSSTSDNQVGFLFYMQDIAPQYAAFLHDRSPEERLQPVLRRHYSILSPQNLMAAGLTKEDATSMKRSIISGYVPQVKAKTGGAASSAAPNPTEGPSSSTVPPSVQKKKRMISRAARKASEVPTQGTTEVPYADVPLSVDVGSTSMYNTFACRGFCLDRPVQRLIHRIWDFTYSTTAYRGPV